MGRNLTGFVARGQTLKIERFPRFRSGLVIYWEARLVFGEARLPWHQSEPLCKPYILMRARLLFVPGSFDGVFGIRFESLTFQVRTSPCLGVLRHV